MTALISGPTKAALIDWFEETGRDLSWRRTRDPWAILIAELMLQQTQAQRVAERLPQFLERFPTAADCASARVGDVITEWSGLGYNRRAVNLHRAAVEIVASHGGEVPQDLGDLLALPGVGPYTARAIRVFAFEFPDAVVDTNIGRVLARLTGESLRPAAAQRLADSLVPHSDPWTWNQAIMEVGALRCRSKPQCSDCPLSRGCHWSRSGCSPPDPAAGSASVSTRQSKFEGSDRQGRGRLLKALQRGPVGVADVAAEMGWPDDVERASRVSATLVADGLAESFDETLYLP